MHNMLAILKVRVSQALLHGVLSMLCCMGFCQRFVVLSRGDSSLYGVLSMFCFEVLSKLCCMEFCQRFVVGNFVNVLLLRVL